MTFNCLISYCRDYILNPLMISVQLLLHFKPLDDFCAASFRELYTLCLKLSTSCPSSSKQFPLSRWFLASSNLQYSSWCVLINLNKWQYWSSSFLTTTSLPDEYKRSSMAFAFIFIFFPFLSMIFPFLLLRDLHSVTQEQQHLCQY